MNLHDIKSLSANQLKPNQLILTTATSRIFISYDSVIAVIMDNGDVYLGENWRYSTTTSKYRNKFLGESTAETQAKLDSGEYRLL